MTAPQPAAGDLEREREVRAALTDVLAERMYLAVMQETRDEWQHFAALPAAARGNWLHDANRALRDLVPVVVRLIEAHRAPLIEQRDQEVAWNKSRTEEFTSKLAEVVTSAEAEMALANARAERAEAELVAAFEAETVRIEAATALLREANNRAEKAEAAVTRVRALATACREMLDDHPEFGSASISLHVLEAAIATPETPAAGVAGPRPAMGGHDGPPSHPGPSRTSTGSGPTTGLPEDVDDVLHVLWIHHYGDRSAIGQATARMLRAFRGARTAFTQLEADRDRLQDELNRARLQLEGREDADD